LKLLEPRRIVRPEFSVVEEPETEDAGKGGGGECLLEGEGRGDSVGGYERRGEDSFLTELRVFAAAKVTSLAVTPPMVMSSW
jgi:hypothetical protein